MDTNDLIELITEALRNQDMMAAGGYVAELGAKLNELETSNTPQALEEIARIKEFLNSPLEAPPEPRSLPEQRGPFSPTPAHLGAQPEIENRSSGTTTVLLQKPKRPLNEIPRDPEQPKQNWSPEIPYPIIMVNCEQGLRSSWPKWTEMASYQIRGQRVTGKSSLEESIGLCYWQAGGNIWDLFSSHLEALAWIDAPEAIRESVRFVIPDSTTLGSPYDIKTISVNDAIDIADGSVKESQKIFVVCKRFYGSEGLYFDALRRLSDAFALKDTWDAIDVVLVRESGNWLSARMRASGKNERDANNEFVRWHNELIHSGYACLLDALRLVSITKELRDVLTGVILKAQGNQVLEKERRFLYRIFTADFIRNLPIQNFVLHLGNDAVFTGWFLAPYFHEVRGKDILKRMGISIKFDKKQMRAEEKASHSGGDSRRVIDTDMHERIISMKLKGTSIRTIAAALHLSETSIKQQIKKHRVEGSDDDCSIAEDKGTIHVETDYISDEETQ